MGCFNLKIGDSIYTLTDSGSYSSESDIVTKSDYNIIENYLINGNIGSNYIITGPDGQEMSAKDFFAIINEKVDVSERCSMSVPNSLTAKLFINHLIGQGSTDETKYANNVWSNSSWGNNTWYGFTKQRGVIVTGHRNYSQDQILFRCYESIKDEEASSKSGFYTELIQKMYEEEDNPELTIYDKLTWVANNKRYNLFSLLLEIESKASYVLKGASLRKKLRESPQSYVGYNVLIGNNFYLISDSTRVDLKGDTIRLINMATGKTEVKEISSITKLNDTKTMHIKDSEFCFVGGNWYSVKNGKFNLVTDAESAKLSEYFLGIAPKVVTDLREIEITAHKLFDELKGQEDITVYANGHYWTLGKDGFYNTLGDKLGNYIQVYSVISNTELDSIKKLLPNCNKTILSTSDIRIIGVHQGIDFENVSFSDIKSPVQFSKTKEGKYRFVISYKDSVKSKVDFEQNLFNAFSFYKWICDENNIEYVTSLFNFSTIETLLKEQFPESFDEAVAKAQKHFINGININKLFNFWNEGNIKLPVLQYSGDAVNHSKQILEENKQTMVSKRATKLFKELLDKGFFIYSCEI